MPLAGRFSIGNKTGSQRVTGIHSNAVRMGSLGHASLISNFVDFAKQALMPYQRLDMYKWIMLGNFQLLQRWTGEIIHNGEAFLVE